MSDMSMTAHEDAALNTLLLDEDLHRRGQFPPQLSLQPRYRQSAGSMAGFAVEGGGATAAPSTAQPVAAAGGQPDRFVEVQPRNSQSQQQQSGFYSTVTSDGRTNISTVTRTAL
jgi:hypothetical protein